MEITGDQAEIDRSIEYITEKTQSVEVIHHA
jgi:hypothetical protein